MKHLANETVGQRIIVNALENQIKTLLIFSACPVNVLWNYGISV